VNVELGKHTTPAKEDIHYVVALKDANRGKRDNLWLFIEILRNFFPEVRPTYTLVQYIQRLQCIVLIYFKFLDSDTFLASNTIRILHDRLNSDGKARTDDDNTTSGATRWKGKIGEFNSG
jgi:hypothetical protein